MRTHASAAVRAGVAICGSCVDAVTCAAQEQKRGYVAGNLHDPAPLVAAGARHRSLGSCKSIPVARYQMGGRLSQFPEVFWSVQDHVIAS